MRAEELSRLPNREDAASRATPAPDREHAASRPAPCCLKHAENPEAGAEHQADRKHDERAAATPPGSQNSTVSDAAPRRREHAHANRDVRRSRTRRSVRSAMVRHRRAPATNSTTPQRHERHAVLEGMNRFGERAPDRQQSSMHRRLVGERRTSGCSRRRSAVGVGVSARPTSAGDANPSTASSSLACAADSRSSTPSPARQPRNGTSSVPVRFASIRSCCASMSSWPACCGSACLTRSAVSSRSVGARIVWLC